MRFVCDACQDITNIEADRMEIQGEKLMVYSRDRRPVGRIAKAQIPWRYGGPAQGQIQAADTDERQ